MDSAVVKDTATRFAIFATKPKGGCLLGFLEKDYDEGKSAYDTRLVPK